MKWKIVLKDKVYDEIHTLMKYDKELNGENEIGGWLTGDWTFKDDTGTLLLDRFVIPKQTVSKTEVDISPESMIDTVKELGVEQSNRLKAHWHIHPFGTGETDWSSIDEDKITDFMHPTKNREIFVFLLSSFDWMKARVELRMKTKLLGMEQIIVHSFDNLPVERENSIDIDNPYIEPLKKRIAEKVEVAKTTFPTIWDGDSKSSWWKKYNQPYDDKDDEEEDFVVRKDGKRVHITLSNMTANLIEPFLNTTQYLQTPTKIKKRSNHEIWKYDVDQKLGTAEDLEERLVEELYVLLEETRHDKEVMEFMTKNPDEDKRSAKYLGYPYESPYSQSWFE